MPSARQIRAQRPDDPVRAQLTPYGVPNTLEETEREADGSSRRALTVFLVGAECPFTCVFCDLWKHTLDGPTPAGALPHQLAAALATLPDASRSGRLKLYNASNFFDPRAVPAADLERIADLVAPFDRILVECHARLVDEACLAFAHRLDGRLELAMGLEVADDAVLARLGKQMTLADFDRAARRLRNAAIPFRTFVLVGAPGLPRGPGREHEDPSTWPARSVQHAFAQGAERVTLIPTRGGNGAMERLAELDLWRPPMLLDLEDALDAAIRLAPGPVTADLWDLDALRACPRCFEDRCRRLERINAKGRSEPRVTCDACSV